MPIDIADASLNDTITRLDTGEVGLDEYITQACKRIETVDDELRSFVPEAKRHDRLHAEIKQLLKRFPADNDRPRYTVSQLASKTSFM